MGRPRTSAEPLTPAERQRRRRARQSGEFPQYVRASETLAAIAKVMNVSVSSIRRAQRLSREGSPEWEALIFHPDRSRRPTINFALAVVDAGGRALEELVIATIRMSGMRAARKLMRESAPE